MEIEVNKEIIDFCNLNDLDITTFIYDCIDKGFVQNKWGQIQLKSNQKPNKVDIVTPPIEQKKSEPVKQTPIKDFYGED
jgi:hypothetical protein